MIGADASSGGSSPRVRGAVHANHVALTDNGIIPARAGSSSRNRRTQAASWDHPRACGEQPAPESATVFAVGSSPRVRGAERHGSRGRTLAGIIPARAGSSPPALAVPREGRDHPRACGEQLPRATFATLNPGSSPRVRGAASIRASVRRRRRIIPARAGSRSSHSRPITGATDHPRACGEQWCEANPSLGHGGSSPRVRGAACPVTVRCRLGGIIPARAGSRPSSDWRCSSAGDHPRACGEQDMCMEYPLLRPGSSPRVRGAGNLTRLCRDCGGIIPARAGSSTLANRGPFYRPDHPRACGEQLM